MLVADRTAGAGPVHHQHVGAALPAHAFCKDARCDVGRGAGGKEHGDLNRRAFLWVGGLLPEGVKSNEGKNPKHSHDSISLTVTRRPSFADRIPARITASDAVARSPSI